MSHSLERLTAQRLYMLRVLGTWCRVCILVSGRVTRTTYGAYYSFRATQLLRRMFLTVLNIGDHDMDVLPLSKSFKPRKYDRTRWVMKKQREYLPSVPLCLDKSHPGQWTMPAVFFERAKPCASNSPGNCRLWFRIPFCSAIAGCEVVVPLRKNSKAMRCKPLDRSELFKAPGDWF